MFLSSVANDGKDEHGLELEAWVVRAGVVHCDGHFIHGD